VWPWPQAAQPMDSACLRRSCDQPKDPMAHFSLPLIGRFN